MLALKCDIPIFDILLFATQSWGNSSWKASLICKCQWCNFDCHRKKIENK